MLASLFAREGCLNQTSARVKVLRLFGIILILQWFVFMATIVHQVSTEIPPPYARGLLQPLSAQNNNNNMFEKFAFNRTLASTCFSEICLEETALGLARIFPARTDQNWCLESSGKKKDAQNKWQGLILVKVPKVASSTAAGVALRISHNNRGKPCKTLTWRHQRAIVYQNRTRNRAFVWTTVRDPAERAISTIFFHNISRRRPSKQDNVPDDDIIDQLRHAVDEQTGATSLGQGGFQLRYTAFRDIEPFSFWNASRPRRVRHPTALYNLVKDTLSKYDFVAVTDRMDESLVAMALQMNVPVSDVLVTSAKVSGQHYHLVHLPKNEFKCLPTLPSYVSRGVQRFLGSDTWKAANWGDYLLHKAASLSLDRTIADIGQERFESALAEYRRLRDLGQAYCAPRVVYPCSDDGIPQPELSKESCYLPFFDFGCGYKCIDHMIEREKSATPF